MVQLCDDTKGIRFYSILFDSTAKSKSHLKHLRRGLCVLEVKLSLNLKGAYYETGNQLESYVDIFKLL